MLMRSVLGAGCVALMAALLVSCGGSSPTGTIYLVGQSDQTVGAYQINLDTGVLKTNNNAGSSQLVPIGKLAKTGVQPTILAFNPGKTTAFLADLGAPNAQPQVPSDIMTFSVNHDGSLTASGTTTLNINTNPVAFAMDPGGKFLFVAEQGVPGDKNCSSQAIDPTKCMARVGVFGVSGSSLSEVAGSPFALLTPQQVTANPSALIITGIAVSNSGNFVYVTDQANNIVVGFTFDSSTGVLTQVKGNAITGTFPGKGPSSAFSPPINNFLYVTNASSNDISQYQIQTDGSLEPVGTNIAAGNVPVQMLSDLNAKYLLVVGNGSNQISGFRINQVTGVLTALTPAAASTGNSPIAATIRSDNVVNGNYWIVVSDYGANAVSTIKLTTNTGGLSALPQILAPVAPYGIASR